MHEEHDFLCINAWTYRDEEAALATVPAVLQALIVAGLPVCANKPRGGHVAKVEVESSMQFLWKGVCSEKVVCLSLGLPLWWRGHASLIHEVGEADAEGLWPSSDYSSHLWPSKASGA